MPPLKREAFSLLENSLDKWQDRSHPRQHTVSFHLTLIVFHGRRETTYGTGTEKERLQVPVFFCRSFVDFCLRSRQGYPGAQAAYYQGKTLTILRGGSPGGYGDLQARALIPYLKKVYPRGTHYRYRAQAGCRGQNGGEPYLLGELNPMG